jgi:integrase
MILGRLYTKWEEYRDGKYLNGTDLSRVILPNKNPASLVPRVKENPRKILINQAMKEHLCNLSVGVMRDFDLSVIIDCLWWTQLRQGDLFNIRPENVHLDAGTIIGIQNKTITTRNPSGNEYRVAIPPERIDVLKRRLSTSIPGKPIFLKTNLQKRWHFLREIAGYHNLQLRDLRGGATSELLDSNIDYETIRKKVGWKGYEMISWYDKRTGENIKNASRALVSVGEKEVDK